MSTKYPSIPEHELTPQGRIYRRSVSTDEKLPEFRGTGATPQEKADHNKAWISKENATGEGEKEKQSLTTRVQHDTYAQELNKRLGPVTFVMDSLQDGIEAAKESVSGDGKATAAADSEMDGESPNSVAGTISQYTQAAWDKVNELKPTLTGAKEPDAKGSQLEETKQQTTEVAEKAKEETSDGSTKLLAAGGDDVMKVLSDGASTQEDPLKANLRVTTEALS